METTLNSNLPLSSAKKNISKDNLESANMDKKLDSLKKTKFSNHKESSNQNVSARSSNISRLDVCRSPRRETYMER